MTACITIPGTPSGKGRPRFRKTANYVQTYTPEKTASYENLVKFIYMSSGYVKFAGALQMEVELYFPIPQSKSKKVKAEMACGGIRPTIKCDIDNCVKVVMDGLNGVAYDDDKQIVSLHADKWYSEEPRVVVTINEVNCT